MIKLYGIGTDVLLVEGNWVINGNWTAVFDKKGNIVDCKEHHTKSRKIFPFLLNVTDKIIGNYHVYSQYNEVIDECLKVLFSRSKRKTKKQAV